MTVYAYVITVQFELRSTLAGPAASQLTVSSNGTITPAPGQTRSDVFRQLFADVTAGRPGEVNPVPLFFSLEPEQLAAFGTELI